MKWKWIRQWFSPPSNQRSIPKALSPELVTNEAYPEQWSGRLTDDAERLKTVFGGSSDFRLSWCKIGDAEGAVCYLYSMTSAKLIAEEVMKPLSACTVIQPINSKETLEMFRKTVFAGPIHQYCKTYHDAINAILSGFAVFLVDGLQDMLAVFIQGYEERSIVEPSTQTIVRGPKDGFVESLQTNMSLIRRRIKNPKLRFENVVLGNETRTDVSLVYMDQIVSPDILQEVRGRIERIDISAIFDSGNLEELIEDRTFTPFPTVYSTERPDSASANLLDGKVGILVDGSPFMLFVPVVFTDFFEVSEDYYMRFTIGSMIRLIRYFAFMLTLILPASYVALSNFHQELIPTPLLISIASQREGVPLPTVVEILMMEITFEILREAGVRMPRAVGQTVSIVGALVIGQAAVEAGIVSNVLLIVVALTGISNFVSPIYSFSNASRIIKFVLIVLAANFGMYGIILGLVLMVAHLASLRSFGVPYLAPVAPFKIKDMDDIFIRFPYWAMKRRPSYLRTKAPGKNPYSKSPSPPEQGGKKP